jgi:hypothetical protein
LHQNNIASIAAWFPWNQLLVYKQGSLELGFNKDVSRDKGEKGILQEKKTPQKTKL